MSEQGISLKDDTPIITLLRINDKSIMKIFLNSKEIKKEWLPTLNKCRLYLQAFSLADITTGSGKYIREKAWHGSTIREEM